MPPKGRTLPFWIWICLLVAVVFMVDGVRLVVGVHDRLARVRADAGIIRELIKIEDSLRAMDQSFDPANRGTPWQEAHSDLLARIARLEGQADQIPVLGDTAALMAADAAALASAIEDAAAHPAESPSMLESVRAGHRAFHAATGLSRDAVDALRGRMAVHSTAMHGHWNHLSVVVFISCGMAMCLCFLLILHHRQMDRLDEAQRALRESAERHQGMLQAIPDLMLLLDSDGTILDCHASQPDLLARSVAEIIGNKLGDVLPRSVSGLAIQRLREAIRTGLTQEFEYSITGSGGPREHEARIAPCGDDRAVVLSRDISARKQFETSLAQSEARLREAQAISHVGSYSWDLRTGAVTWSDELLRIHGREAGDFGSTFDGYIDHVHESCRSLVADAIRRAMRSGAPHDLEYQIVRPTGEVRWVFARARMLRAADGKFAGIEGTCHDITDRKSSEVALRHALHTEKTLYRELDHRVRNNLTSLLTLIDLTRRNTGNVPEFAASIFGRVGAMANVHALLSRSRWQSLDLRSLIETMLPSHSACATVLDGPTVPIPPGQATALSMVIHELMTNSTKYGVLSAAGGRLDVRWSITEAHAGERLLGIGWTESGGPSISAETRPGTGTGLIMGLLKSELHGRATFEYPPQGASHMITIMLNAPAAMLVEPKPNAHSPGIAVTTPSHGLDAVA